jgi:hypothetical protein
MVEQRKRFRRCWNGRYLGFRIKTASRFPCFRRGGESLLELEGLDAGILPVVQVLAQNGVETFESCEGGEGHAFYEPTVRFHGNHAEGFRALA